MPAKFRALLTILVVALMAFGTAIYFGFRSGYDAAAQTSSSGAQNGLAAIDLRNIFNPATTDEHLIATAFRQLERVYYKPVDAQILMHGERVGIADYLRSKGVRNASLPAPSATGDQVSDLRKIDGQLAYAQSHFARRLGANGNVQITQAALRGMMSSLGDPYTVYLSPQEIQSLNESLNGGNFGGIGVYIYQLKDGQVILQPIEGLPAARAGMKPGEVVTSVDGAPVKGLMLDRVERMIRGERGTGVTIVAHPWKRSSQRAYRIVRDIIHVPTVRAKMESGYEYIRLADFGETSADEVRAALLSGKAHGAKGYILDLRDNGGGLLDAAVRISSYFIPAGAIVSTIDRAGLKDQQNALGTAIGGLSPLVVLVNKYTASASEITAGAIADYKVGTLIGTKTFGKGVVQSIYPMTDRSALKITTARYVTPAGRDIQHKGIAPDILVNQNPDPGLIDTPRDAQLAAAKAHLAAHRR
ncbi:MAG: S41 family peptidase [Candidatus Eremiobacteraeota bacterium]|nr:S41 family peptidase [Candidatus Eremiobacteraeota bacterium]MDQ6823085.1 S41 family peptidase [Candidatus Eremiobacteraeota bacterium]